MRLGGLVERVGNPLAWHSAAKVMLVSGIFLAPVISLAVRAQYLAVHPEVEPYIDRAVLARCAEIGFFFVAFLVASFVVGGFLVRAGRDSAAFVQVANLVWWLVFGSFTYLLGPATTPMYVIFPLLSLMTLLLFRTRDALPGIIMAILVVIGTTIAERLGLLPYAPYFASWPEVDGRIAGEWVIATTAWTSFAAAASLLVYTLILRRWREQSARLAEMTEVLKGMFGRYMSTEVMKTLLEDPGALELGGARRRVTMLLTDLRGFSALAERLSPEDVLSLLNDYFEVMVDVCLHRQGTINEITGDALLVTFGAANEMEDHAARAVACAIEMQNAMAQVNARNANRQRPVLQMGIAVHTAEVIVGNIGSEKRSKFGVVGSAVNMTARIESYSLGGQVLASQSIVDEVGRLLRIDDRRQFTPKGFSEPLTVYEIGGIAGPYNVALELGDEALSPLPKPLPVCWAKVSDKRLDGVKGEANISRVSPTGVELAPSAGLHVMDDVRLNLSEGSAYLTRCDVYAKVTWQSDGVAHLRFTSIPPEVLTYFEGIGSRLPGPASPSSPWEPS